MIKSKSIIINLFVIFGLFFSLWAQGATHEPLTMDQGFKFSAKVKDSQTIIAQWQMAPGYFLHRNHLQISSNSPNTKLGDPLFPQSITKTEPGFGSFEVYKDQTNIPVPVISAKDNKVTLIVRYQGCSEEGYCYPPTEKKVTVDMSAPDPSLNNLTTQPIAKTLGPQPSLADLKDLSEPLSAQDQVSKVLSSGHYFTIILSFLGFGLLLAFTPCMLPMVPILSGIIVGQKRDSLTAKRAFSLSFIYVLSMSLTYAIAGILIGYAGGSIQAAFQKPWMLITFSMMFVALALSFFGLYELQLPQSLQSKLSSASTGKGGNYLGVALMGCLATLIVSPCVTPALVGALGYIGKTGNATLGGSALFALGFGMGIPLLLIGTAGSKLLPKAGVWMDRVKYFFAFLLLAMAIWIVDRILPGIVTLLLWSFLAIFAATFMGLFTSSAPKPLARFTHGVAAILFVYGVILLVGASMGHTNPLQPLAFAEQPAAMTAGSLDSSASFKNILHEHEINSAISEARNQNKIVMVDFSAKWCTSCKLMEHRTFKHPDVIKALDKFVALKADVTDNDNTAKQLQQRFQVVAPPTLLFFDSKGRELAQYRIVGEMGPKEFLEHLENVKKASQ